MNSVVRIQDLIKGKLSKEHYFQSLLLELCRQNLLSKREAENIQFQLLDILKETINYYTKGESASVLVEVAEKLTLSIYYTIGVYLKSKKSIDKEISLLKEEKLKALFSEGEKLLKEEINQGKELLELVFKNKVKTENYAYNDTIDYGIPLFFIEYDYRFASHEAPGSIDYPLFKDNMDRVGIDYINNYLKNVYLENEFCSYFSSESINALLRGYDKGVDHLLINIFEFVYRNSLASVLTGKSANSLDLSKNQVEYLQKKLEVLSSIELDVVIKKATVKIIKELGIQDIRLIDYLKVAAGETSIYLKERLKLNKLNTIFFLLNFEGDNNFKYEDGKSLENDIFKEISEEIRECKSVEDKIEIIKEEIHSLRDLADILGADCIFKDEFKSIFKSLSKFEVALLYKNVPEGGNCDNYGTTGEEEWHNELQEYINEINEDERREIIDLANNLEL